MSSATLQKSIEDYMSPGRAAAAAAGQPAAMGGKAAAAAVPPPPPPAAEVIGQPLLKDFRCEESGKIRPFSGAVTEFHATKKWGGLYRVVYEDGDSEDLAWEQLHGFLQRAAAAGASKAGGSKPAGGSSQAGGGKAAAPAARLQQHAAPAPAAAAQKAPAGKHSAASKASGAAAAAAVAEPVPAKKQGRPAKGGAQPAAKQAKIGAGRKAQPGGGNGKAALAAKKTPTKATPAKQPVANKNPILLATPKSNTQYVYARGEEPWRREAAFTWAVNDEPDMSATAVNNIRRVQRDYNRRYIRAATEEKIRVDAIIGKQKAAGTYKTKGVPTPANRPDRVVESIMKSGKMVLTDAAHKVAGHYPGWKVGARAYSRSELGCIGFHCSPIAGIDFVGVGKGGNGMPSFATSVMMSGWYQDDDDSGSMMWYTGAGGNALLNSRKQVADQKLNPANSALLGNIQLGIPVRVTRKQTDKHGHYGCAYVYDGLYDVVAYRRKKGITDKYVYQFQMIRREGQGPLLSERVEWRTIATAKDLAPKTRQGVVDLDISRGKEAKPIAAIDTTWLALGELAGSGPQGDLPPCTGLDDVAKERELAGNVVRGINEARLAQLRGQQYKAGVQYISQYEFAVEPPTLRQAVLPSKHAGNPHAYLRELNRGTPYNDRGQLYNSRPVVYECGPWAKCPDGHDCKQAVTQRPIKFWLEVFKTVTGCGWGVRCLDTIPQHAYVCTYIGEVYDRETHEHLVRTVEEQDAEYTFDMACRQETNWDGTEKEREDPDFKAEFVCCGLRKRNVGAFLNHSCAPNCFVQPVLDAHHDTRLPKICIFAMENIAPLTELTLDYGTAYASGFPGGCKCGAADCISGPLSPAQAEAMAAAAARAAAVEVDAEEQKALEAEERKKAKEEEAKQIEAELRKAKAAAKKRGTAAAGKGKAAQAAVEEEEEEEEGSEEGEEEGDDEEGSEEGGESSEEEDEGDEAASSPAEESSSGEEDWEEDDK